MDNGTSVRHRFLRNNDMSMEELVKKYGDSLVRYAYCFLCDSQAAEDVMEDAFVALIVKRKHFDEEVKLKAYLYKIVRNKCIDALRVRNRTVPLEDLENVLTSSDTETIFFASNRNRFLYRGLQAIPRQYREILFLVYFDDLSISDAANVLKKTKKQVYNLLARAKTSLKDFFIKAGINYEYI